ncbi:MAG: cytochrome-c peroxidase [Aureispira sp.]
MIRFYSILIVLFGLASFMEIEAPTTAEELGEHLFFDPLLSLDSTISCSSCHLQEFAFADTVPFSVGVNGQLGNRNTPSSMNMLARPHFFYDGRAASLEEQVLMPIHNPIEMALPISDLVERLQNSPYKAWFEDIYGHVPDSSNISAALAAYIFTLESVGDSPFDQWMRGDTTAMTAAQIRGRLIFNEKGKCFDCHFGPDFTGDEFRNIGLFTGQNGLNDQGRFVITNDSSDLGKLKVPGLRNIAVTAPYMHNGQFKTLAEVVDYYDDPSQFVQGAINRDTLLAAPLQLSTQEKADVVAFLEALTDKRYQH